MFYVYCDRMNILYKKSVKTNNNNKNKNTKEKQNYDHNRNISTQVDHFLYA